MDARCWDISVGNSVAHGVCDAPANAGASWRSGSHRAGLNSSVTDLDHFRTQTAARGWLGMANSCQQVNSVAQNAARIPAVIAVACGYPRPSQSQLSTFVGRGIPAVARISSTSTRSPTIPKSQDRKPGLCAVARYQTQLAINSGATSCAATLSASTGDGADGCWALLWGTFMRLSGSPRSTYACRLRKSVAHLLGVRCGSDTQGLLGDAKNAQWALPWYPGDLEKHLVPRPSASRFQIPSKTIRRH